MLRSAMREDEWLLLLHGAVLGFVRRPASTWRSSAGLMTATPTRTQPRDAPATGRGRSLLARPGLARIAASAAWRSTGWTVGASMRAGSRGDPRRGHGRVASGAVPATAGRDPRVRRTCLASRASTTRQPDRSRALMTPEAALDRGHHRESLRQRGEELLRRSADVDFAEDVAPGLRADPRRSWRPTRGGSCACSRRGTAAVGRRPLRPSATRPPSWSRRACR